ncbi:hypothetical protein BS47DRAFT_487546 [Hydnum rufescens UP504]|uniref:Catalase core domain-containing protein n=1 Tax=Hydnum rufescens UP504 TaxID=1448309 RepID=A0A9P6AHN0_9AGAM|nr:hypothetical protein BS47DRAFT_487546 [Hydnum rufescens UP504]
MTYRSSTKRTVPYTPPATALPTPSTPIPQWSSPPSGAHFDCERIPERVIHAKGAGAHGIFKVTHDISDFTSAVLFSNVVQCDEKTDSISTSLLLGGFPPSPAQSVPLGTKCTHFLSS